MSKKVSIVIPCYNEEAVISETLSQLLLWSEAEHRRSGYAIEWVLIDDGSRDQTVRLIQNFSKQLKTRIPLTIQLIPLSKNQGHQLALSCGLDLAQGDAVISIDADLQDPPSVMTEFLVAWESGAQVVHGVRKSREGETSFKKLTASLFYRLFRFVTQTDFPLNAGDFRLMDQAVLREFRMMKERHRYIRGMIPWLGFRQKEVFYDRAARFAGSTHYPFFKMVKLAFDAILSFSVIPLRLSLWIGVLCASVSTFLGAWVLVGWMQGQTIQGWSSLMLGMFFFGSVQLIVLGVIGEYLGRVYEQVKGRPLYVVNSADQSRWDFSGEY